MERWSNKQCRKLSTRGCQCSSGHSPQGRFRRYSGVSYFPDGNGMCVWKGEKDRAWSNLVAFPFTGEQRRVFEDAAGKRKVIFATKCAKKSITIRYFVGTGMVKEMTFDPKLARRKFFSRHFYPQEFRWATQRTSGKDIGWKVLSTLQRGRVYSNGR